MESNSTDPTAPEDGNSSGQSFASPVSILPLLVSIATMAAIVVVACVLWRRRQRRRARVLARQLTATQRRIDTLKALRRKAATSSTKTEYHPPADLQVSLSSIEDVSLHRARSARNRPGHFTLSLAQPPVHSSEAFKPAPSLPPPVSENDTSFQCSTCPGSADLAGGHNPTDSSMAVECDTTRPTISPVNAVRTTRKAHLPPLRQRTSDITTSNAGTWGSSSTLQPSAIHSDHSTPTLHWVPMGSTPLFEDVTSDPTQEGRPNTPVTSASESSLVVVRAEGYQSHDQEKWV